MSELELLAQRIVEGDPAAENELCNRIGRPILTMMRFRSGDADLAQDLAQETLRILIEKLREDMVSDHSRLSGYAHGIAINLLIGHRRKEKSRATEVNSPIAMEAVCEQESQFDQLRREQEGTMVLNLLDSLRNDRDREILKRTFLLDQDKPEVCKELGLSPAHFDRVIHRAKQRLRKQVENDAAMSKYLEGGA